MDSIWMIIIFAIIAVISDKMDSKPKVKKPKQPPVIIMSPPDKKPVKVGDKLKQPLKPTKKLTIEIPDLKSAPVPKANDNVYREPDKVAIVTSKVKPPIPKKVVIEEIESQVVPATKLKNDQVKKPAVNDLRQAIIWSEILGKPRAYRHFRH